MVACDGRSLAGPTHLSAVCERRSTDRSRSTACMFTRMLQQARRTPEQFTELAAELFRVMAAGGRVGFEAVAWFNGGLFDDGAALPLEAADIETVLAASDLDWSEIDPSILGTLFERGLDPGKRAQLGAHYTDRDKIMLLVEPVVIRPWLAEWDAAKAEIAGALDRVEAAKSPAARTKRLNAAERQYRAFLNRLRVLTVLDPACGSGNFLYLALQALKDLEHRVQLEAEALGFQRAFPDIGPANVKGLEICRDILPEVTAIEVKVDNWQRALSQALRNRTFAHRSFIALPVKVAARVRRAPALLQSGIGVIERVLASRPAAGPAAETVKGWTREWLEKASTENGAPAHAGLGPADVGMPERRLQVLQVAFFNLVGLGGPGRPLELHPVIGCDGEGDRRGSLTDTVDRLFELLMALPLGLPGKSFRGRLRGFPEYAPGKLETCTTTCHRVCTASNLPLSQLRVVASHARTVTAFVPVLVATTATDLPSPASFSAVLFLLR